jgi:LuxR family transcriptional regulator, maltose regulon positive regulatory protein
LRRCPPSWSVLGLVAAGRANQEIADELVVTLETVKKHLSHVFDKLGAANRTEAMLGPASSA